jgi:nucleoid DNA-binding protein
MNKAEIVEEVTNQTGETIEIPAKRVAKFIAGKGLRLKVK